jgi:hypothetical protein
MNESKPTCGWNESKPPDIHHRWLGTNGGTMTPLGRYSIYCDHGIHVGSECWRCWQRRALDAEATIAELREELAARKEYLTAYRDAATTDTINSRRRTARWKRIVVRMREELAQWQNAAGR